MIWPGRYNATKFNVHLLQLFINNEHRLKVNNPLEGRNWGWSNMELRETETEILQTAIAAFHKATGIPLHLQRREPQRHGHRADAELRFGFPKGERRFDAEVKPAILLQTLGLAVEQIKRLPEKV